jgi:hypothetical protein
MFKIMIFESTLIFKKFLLFKKDVALYIMYIYTLKHSHKIII